MVRRRVVVHGRVQGVFFRDSCRQEANRRGVRGTVANRADGAVEAVFEGSEEDVRTLCDWCAHGPSQARVERVETTEEPVRGAEWFEIV